MPSPSVQFHGPQAIAAIRRGSTRGVNLAMELLRAQSVAKAPVDLGDLKASASVELATEAQPDPTAVLVFDEPYAAAQHEHTEYHHTPGAHGEPAGQAKYVESNYLDAGKRAEYEAIIGTAVSDALAGR